MDMGVSFEFTEQLDAQTRRDLIMFIGEWRKTHKKETLV